jgi:hypothetical protein
MGKSQLTEKLEITPRYRKAIENSGNILDRSEENDEEGAS